MLFFLNKYFRRKPRRRRTPEEEDKASMPSFHAEHEQKECLPGCVLGFARRGTATGTAVTTTKITRSNFVKSATSLIYPGTHFTNHESLPSLPDALSSFLAAFPQYDGDHQEAAGIRNDEYRHLEEHVCLDYTGINLFSHAQMNLSVPSTSTTPVPSSNLWQPPFFDIAYKSASLRSQVQSTDRGTSLEAAMTRRIMASLKIPDEEYCMVCTANRTTAFRLLAESYCFRSNRKLLTVYDYESEAVTAMAESAQRQGADIMSSSFTWPSLRIHSEELRKKLIKRNKNKKKGLFVFPLMSRMSGARYPYLWMSLAHENGWHVALDACALGSKDLDTFGLSIIRPDFIICNFFKVFGENPSGFAGLFVKKSSHDALQGSMIARSIGIVSIVPAKQWCPNTDDYSSTDLEAFKLKTEDDDVETTSSFSGPIPPHYPNASLQKGIRSSEDFSFTKATNFGTFEKGETSEVREDLTREEEKEELSSEMEIECRGLDHADTLHLVVIGTRLRCIINWLVVAMRKLRHPHADDGHALVRIYGPRVKFERGPALAFNVFDWKGEKIEPSLVQKLADRNKISLSSGFLNSIWFSDKYETEKNAVLEPRRLVGDTNSTASSNKRKSGDNVGIHVVNASLGFLTNFEDAYRLWAFVAKFLDADFVEKERWRYMALNQKMVEV